ncbi:MAG: CvpA family protein [Alphaproteobacteria bacterium]
MSGLALTSADYVVFGVLAISALFAFSRGSVREMAPIGTWVGAAFAALYGFTGVRALAHRFTHPDWLADIGTALGLFFLAFIAISLVTRPILARIETSELRGIDRLWGFSSASCGAPSSSAWPFLGR